MKNHDILTTVEIENEYVSFLAGCKISLEDAVNYGITDKLENWGYKLDEMYYYIPPMLQLGYEQEQI